MDSRSDLPKVHYATALDWFIICSFLYCIASILEFAGVHYFTKVGINSHFCSSIHAVISKVNSGESFGNDAVESEIFLHEDEEEEDDDEWEDIEDWNLETPKEINGARFSFNTNWNNHVKIMPNQENQEVAGLNHKPLNPLNHNCISAYNNAYGLNGSLSESSESVPVMPKHQVQTYSNYHFQ